MVVTRKRPEDKSQVWKPRRSVSLYLDDLDELLFAVKDLGEMKIDTEDFAGTVASANEVRDVLEGQNQSDLRFELTSTDRTLCLEVAPEMSLTISPRDDLLVRGASERIKDLVNPRMHRLGGLSISKALLFRAYGPAYLFLLMVVGSQVQAARAGQAGPGLIVPAILAIGVVMAALGWAIWGTNPHPSGKLRLVFKAEAPGWWKEHRSAIVVNLATNTLVAALFFWLGLLLGG